MNILLVCTAGMSTSMLVKRMQDSAKAREIEANIWAVGDAKAKDESQKADIVMIGPQIRFMESKIKGYVPPHVPVIVIDMRMYGAMDGNSVLDVAIKNLNK